VHIELSAETIPSHARPVSDVVVAGRSRRSWPKAQSAMGIETDTLDDDFSHPAIYRGDYACLCAREKDQLYELPDERRSQKLAFSRMTVENRDYH
jgi:hypothetical protein